MHHRMVEKSIIQKNHTNTIICVSANTNNNHHHKCMIKIKKYQSTKWLNVYVTINLVNNSQTHLSKNTDENCEEMCLAKGQM